jgi:hypothetical protein
MSLLILGSELCIIYMGQARQSSIFSIDLLNNWNIHAIRLFAPFANQNLEDT